MTLQRESVGSLAEVLTNLYRDEQIVIFMTVCDLARIHTAVKGASRSLEHPWWGSFALNC